MEFSHDSPVGTPAILVSVGLVFKFRGGLINLTGMAVLAGNSLH